MNPEAFLVNSAMNYAICLKGAKAMLKIAGSQPVIVRRDNDA